MKYRAHLVFTYFTFILATNLFAQDESGKSTTALQLEWLEALYGDGEVGFIYNDQSGLMINDSLYIGAQQTLFQARKLRSLKLRRYSNQATIQLRENQKFEMGTYYNSTGEAFATVIGWRKQDGWIKEFETISKVEVDSSQNADLVNNRRRDWERLANEHRPDLISQNVFSKKGKYFNRGRAYYGSEIAHAYRYMNNEGFKITLEALNTNLVTDSTLFEVGQYDVGGKGLYVLIWTKEGADWNLLLDFNF